VDVIITVTPNPGLDLTYTFPAASDADVDVHRATSSTLEASGKGVNVSRALAKVGVPTCAVLPAGGPTGRALVELLDDDGVSHRITHQAGETRVNTTALRPGGVTLKLNGPGGELSAAEQESLLQATSRALEEARESAEGTVWVAVCGSLPPGVGTQLVVDLVDLAHRYGAKCAVDASGDALTAALSARADLLAPNRLELAEVSPAAHTTDSVEELADAARALSLETRAELLISLGREGALYTDGRQVLHGFGPPLTPINTAGAGDALLAGWLSTEAQAGTRLARAISWGRSACLAATTVDPDPGKGDTAPVTILDLTTARSA
jgi:1-phosphofructokinase